MTATNNIQNSEDGIDSRLKELFGNESPYKVPDGYFEELPAQVLESCHKSDNKSIRPLYRKAVFRNIAAAAAILIMAALVITMVYTNRQTQADIFTDYSLKDAYQYNFNNLADLEEAYLLSLIGAEADEDLFLIETDAGDISDEDIIEYLLAENHKEYYTFNKD